MSIVKTHVITIYEDPAVDTSGGDSPFRVTPRIAAVKPSDNVQFVNATDQVVDVKFDAGNTPFTAGGPYKVNSGQNHSWSVKPNPIQAFPYDVECGSPDMLAQASRPIIIIID